MSTENLNQQEAIDKLKVLVEKIDICMFCTGLTAQPFESSPMSIQEVDENGHLWFLSSRSSKRNEGIRTDARVQLLFANPADYNFISVFGMAQEVDDQARIEKYWNRFMEAWFEKGKEDPDITIIKVIPERAHYWDNKSNKLGTMITMVTSAITGSKLDIGRHGDLNL